MKNIKTHEIATLLLLPSFLLGGVITDSFSFLFRIDNYSYFTQWHVGLIVVLVGTLAIFTYNSVLNVLSIFPSVKAKTAKIITYLFSLLILGIGAIVALKYVWSKTLSTGDSLTVTWPATFSSSQTPVIMFTQEFLVSIVIAVGISFAVATALKVIWRKKYGHDYGAKIHQNDATRGRES